MLFEFFEDQLLAFLFLSVLWICEVLMMVRYFTSNSRNFKDGIYFFNHMIKYSHVFSVQAYRPSSPMRFLPCFTGLYLIAFLIYHFSFTYGWYSPSPSCPMRYNLFILFFFCQVFRTWPFSLQRPFFSTQLPISGIDMR